MKSFIKVNLVLLIVLFISVDCGSRGSNTYSEDRTPQPESHVCGIETAVMIGALYVYSSPLKDSEEMQEFVSEYSDFLGANSDVIRCMRNLGNSFIQQGTTQFEFTYEDENQVRSSVYDMAAGSGLDATNIADNITGSMRSEALQPIIVGQELLWLAEVIPEAADYNWDKYETTGTYFRQQALQQAAQYNAILELYGAYDPEMQALMDAIMPEMNQWIDDYGMWYIISSGVYLEVFQ